MTLCAPLLCSQKLKEIGTTRSTAAPVLGWGHLHKLRAKVRGSGLPVENLHRVVRAASPILTEISNGCCFRAQAFHYPRVSAKILRWGGLEGDIGGLMVNTRVLCGPESGTQSGALHLRRSDILVLPGSHPPCRVDGPLARGCDGPDGQG